MFSSRLLSLFPRLPKLKPRHVNLPMDTNLTKGFPRSLCKVLSSYDEKRFNFHLPQLTWGVAAMVGLTEVEQESNEDSDSDKEDEEYSDANDNSFEESYMESKEVFDNVKIDIITGDKDGSEWLVLDEVYILHKYRSTETEMFWECSGRRHFNCPVKAATAVTDDGEKHELIYMYKADRHDCGQTKMGPILQKFRNRLKIRMKENFKNKFHTIFAEEKKKMLNEHRESPELLERIIYEIKDKRTYRVCAQRARAKSFPKNPTLAEEMDLSLIGLKRFELGRSSHFDPEVKDKEIILLGTPLTAKAWAQSEFKSGDGTFKICPKQFYQVLKPFLLLHKYIQHCYFLGLCSHGSLWWCLLAMHDWSPS